MTACSFFEYCLSHVFSFSSIKAILSSGIRHAIMADRGSRITTWLPVYYKRHPFTLQKDAFYVAICLLLRCKRRHIEIKPAHDDILSPTHPCGSSCTLYAEIQAEWRHTGIFLISVRPSRKGRMTFSTRQSRATRSLNVSIPAV